MYELTRRKVMTTTAIATLGAGTKGTVGELTETAEDAAKLDTNETDVSAPLGVQTGDVVNDRAIVWSRADRPARMFIEVSTDEDFEEVRTIRGPAALEVTDYAATLDLRGLPRGEQIHYRVIFEDLRNPGARSDPVKGSFATPPTHSRDIRFVWGGDVAGQGWGINPEFGGMKTFETMREVEPDFFIHSGDAVYADGPIPPEIDLEDGGVWENVTTEAKAEVADTLEEFRGNYRYNLLDEHYRQFTAMVPMIAQWDDHEVLNNWYPNEQLPAEDPHDVKSVDLLAARGQRAFMDYMPVRAQVDAWDELYDNFPYGPSLEIFRLDLRSYRGPNRVNDGEPTERGPKTAILGEKQLDWLKQALKDSEATWKIIASDMPIGLVIPDEETTFEGIANSESSVRDRELEIAELLRFIDGHGIDNVVWFTADVHYTAAHHYDPDQAQFQEFTPFWEFVSGPLHAGTFGPSELDDTFGPEVVYQKTPDEGESNLPPSDGLQFFGQVDIDGDSENMTVTLKDLDGTALYEKELKPGGD
jgi:alkaline phosphatase D